MTAKYQYIEEQDDEGDVIPNGVFSGSDVDEIASDREDSIADDYDSETDDPSTFCEIESEGGRRNRGHRDSAGG